MTPDTAANRIDTFCTDYAFRPNDRELRAMTEWAMTIDEDMLVGILDPESHSTGPSGRKQRPNLADLKMAVNDIRRDRGDFRRQEDQSLLDGEDCFYCDNGFVSAVDTRNLIWTSGIIGRCGECKAMGGNRGANWYEVVKPLDRIIELAREWETTCPQAVDRIVEQRAEMYREPY